MNIKEILKGAGSGVVTVLFMVGLLPWDLVSKLISCLIAMLAILRIIKKKNRGENVTAFTASYVGVLVVLITLLNLILSGASAA